MTQTQEQLPQIGTYTVLRDLGADAFGQLYRVRHSNRTERLLMRLIPPDVVNGDNFLVRFEMLRPLLPTIAHRNLVRVVDLGTADNLYYIVYMMPAHEDGHMLPTFHDFNRLLTENRQRVLEQIFSGIAHGLLALMQIRDSFYKRGLPHEALSPDRIFIAEEPALVGGAIRFVPQILGFGEAFLYYGDNPEAVLQYRLRNISRLGDEDSLFREEWLHPPTSRRLDRGRPHVRPSYSYGQLVYKTLGKISARGIYPSLLDIDATIDPHWDKICEVCLAESELDEEGRLGEVVRIFSSMNERRQTLTALERTLRNMDVPPTMALINFDDKVELGSSDGAENEGPSFRAKLRPFLIDKTPVTVAQFQEFLSNYQPSSYSRGNSHPATLVSWQLAKAYCRWRSEKEGLPPDTYRLPTEYEWEAAARGCLGHQYPWGPEPERQRCHCDQEKEFGAVPVKTHPAMRFGLFDMLGNVWEWTESVFKPHPFSKHKDRRYDLDLRVVKGGCWFTPFDDCRASLRNAFPEEERGGHIGFRCVRPINLVELTEES